MNYFKSKCRLAMLATTALVSGLAAPAHGQAVGQPEPPAVRQPVDENDIDVVRGTYSPGPKTSLSIGQGGSHGLSLDRIPGSSVSSLLSAIENVGGKIVVTLGARSNSFGSGGGGYVSTEGDGSTLTLISGIYTYTSRDGVVARFASNAGYGYSFYYGELGRLGSITYPDGSVDTITMRVQTVCPGGYENNVCQSPLYYLARVQSINNSNGYQLKASYASNASKLDDTNVDAWGTITATRAINNAVEYCEPSANTCTLTGSWPTPNTPPNFITFTQDPTTYRIATATNRGVTSSYAYADSGTTRTTTVTDPNGGTRVYTGDTATFLISAFRDELNRTTGYQYDASGRVTRVTAPEGNYTEYSYDARGNVTQTRNVAKSGSGLTDIVTSAGYDTTCTNPKTCNKPNWTRDARGNQTDYTYDAGHGGVLTVTAPAGASGIRPQTRYSYSSVSATYWQPGYPSATFSAGPAMQRLMGISTCQTLTSCTGTADEAKTTIGYGTNNALPTSVTSGSGNGALSVSASATYDNIANRITVDGPLAGTADTSRTRYDTLRQVVGIVGPDPDGAGARLLRAQRFTYDANRQVTLAEIGTVTNQSDGAWAAFSSQQQVATNYDAGARPVKQELKSGGTTYALGQLGYDALGRVDCSAQRMDPAQWASQTVACTPQTTGAYGADRITKNIYNMASEVTSVQTAYGTADQANEVTATFNTNGTTATVKDGENNLTTYEYDGFDRLLKTRYPVATQGANSSSATDYEQFTYDANGNVTQRRLRDGQVQNHTLDNLNRVTAVDRPGAGVADQDYSRSYDLLGRLTNTNDVNGRFAGFVFDALGRLTTETTNFATTSYQYDAAGRKTRLTWGDSFYVTYDYDVTGNVTAIRENGAGSGIGVLGTYAYDNLGRRTSLTRGNGAVTSYSFDPVSRLSSFTQDLASTASDLTVNGFTYNPASQITSLVRSNDLYAWVGHYNEDRTATLNGLNQQTGISNATTSTSVNLTHDGRGNITGVGASGYGYNSDNQLATAPNVEYLYYDTLGRLDHLVLPDYSSWTGFDYDGQALIAETQNNTTNILRRYVHGPGTDEPLVWYEGSGTSDRRWLHTDERGSVVAVSNASGASIATNSYDAYGKPASTNLGRFGYTGQAWLPELGMWYYKARIYNPANNVARFMQADPIGYAAGMNLYSYVGGDPVNLVDPSGLINDRPCSGPNPTVCGREDGSSIGPDLTVTAPRIDHSICNACSSPPGFLDNNPGFTFGNGPGAGGDGGFGEGSVNAAPPLPAKPAEGEDKRGCGRSSDIADAGLYVLGFTGAVADVTSLGLAGASAMTGVATPPGASAAFGAVVANRVSATASAAAIPINLYQGNFRGALANVAGAIAGSFAARIAGKALGASPFKSFKQDVADKAAGQAVGGATGC